MVDFVVVEFSMMGGVLAAVPLTKFWLKTDFMLLLLLLDVMKDCPLIVVGLLLLEGLAKLEWFPCKVPANDGGEASGCKDELAESDKIFSGEFPTNDVGGSAKESKKLSIHLTCFFFFRR